MIIKSKKQTKKKMDTARKKNILKINLWSSFKLLKTHKVCRT